MRKFYYLVRCSVLFGCWPWVCRKKKDNITAFLFEKLLYYTHSFIPIKQIRVYMYIYIGVLSYRFLSVSLHNTLSLPVLFTSPLPTNNVFPLVLLIFIREVFPFSRTLLLSRKIHSQHQHCTILRFLFLLKNHFFF